MIVESDMKHIKPVCTECPICSPSETEFKDKSVSEYVLEKCRHHRANGKTTCTIDTISEESYTYAQFDKLSQNIASSFFKRGMRKGDTVVYMCYDIVKLHIFFMGVWRANGIVRALYPEELEDSILETVSQCNSKWILCDKAESPKCLSASEKIGWPVEVITMDRDVEGCTSIYELFNDDGDQCPELETKGEDPAIILGTSGTTGRSKGAVHSHKSVISICEKMQNTIELGEKNLLLGRGSHISGALITFVPIVLGRIVYTTSKITLENFFTAIESFKPNWVFAFPAFLLALANDSRAEHIDKSSLEFISCGGSSIKPSLEIELKHKCPNLKNLSGVYGLTESAPVLSTAHKLHSEAGVTPYKDLPFGSMGKVICGVSAQIRDEFGQPLGPNKEGELCIKNTIMFSRYFKQDCETQKAFTEDNWFRTGDIMSYDENGFLFFCGRQKEMFKCSGNHVFPVEIDEVISKHPSVADVCTVGIHDPEGEKMPRAFVVLKPGAITTADEIKKFAHEHLPTYKYLRGGLYIVQTLPKGITGKVSRILAAEIPVMK